MRPFDPQSDEVKVVGRVKGKDPSLIQLWVEGHKVEVTGAVIRQRGEEIDIELCGRFVDKDSL